MAAADGAGVTVEAGLAARLEIPGLEGFEVVGVDLSEGLSRRTLARVEVASHDDVDWASALLRPCTLVVDLFEQATRAPISSRRWTLRLGEGSFAEHNDSAFRFVLELHDPLWPLGLGRDTRKFRNQSAQDIVSTILGEAGLAFAWQLAEPLPVRKYTAQYRESKLAFVERLLEHEGVHYRFAEDGTVLFGDTTAAAERLRGGRPYELIEGAQGMVRGDVGLHALRRGRRITTGKVTFGDYNWKKPDLALSATAEGETDVVIERYEYAAGFRKPEQGARLAQLRVEAYRAQAAFLEGRANEPAFAPGLGIAVGGEAAAAFEGEFLLTEIEHVARAGNFSAGKEDGEASRYETRFSAIPIDRPWRPLPRTPRPRVEGIHTAMVRGPAGEEIHTDRYGRFRAQLHWDREAVASDEDSRWMRLVQETSSSMTLARTGWEVMVGYVDGDPDRPLGLGRAINGQMTPSYGQPSNKTMLSIKTPSSPATGGFNEIKMDDSAGAQHISVQAEKDFDALIKNDKTETVGLDETHTVTNDFKRHLQANQAVTIGRHDSADYKATSELKVGGDRSVTVAVSESVKVGGGQKATVTKQDSEKVGVARINVVGSLKKPDWKKMAQSALDGLNPIKALEGKLKNPLAGLLPGLEGNSTKEIKDNLLAKLKGLPDAIKDDVLKTLKEEGQGILKSAEKAAKEAYKKNGLGAAVEAGVGALEGGVEKSFDKLEAGLPAAIKNSLRSNLEALLGELPEEDEDAKKKKDPETPAAVSEGDGKAKETPAATASSEAGEGESEGDDVKESSGEAAASSPPAASEGAPKAAAEEKKKDAPAGLDKAVVEAAKNSVSDYIAHLPDVFQNQAANYVKSILPDFGQKVPDKLEGAGGILPSLEQLKQMYTGESLEKGLTTKLEGALNTATGGLYESFFPKSTEKGQNEARQFTIGWAQIDKLIDMFTTGGISKTTEQSIQILVGGVTIKAALNKITWGSQIAWMETIGGVKYTRTPLKIDQDVDGKMMVNVLGSISRNAGKDIAIRSDGVSTIDVVAKSTLTITETLELNGKTKVLVEATDELVLKGAATTAKLSPGGLKLDGKKLSINAAPKGVVIKGAKTALTKS